MSIRFQTNGKLASENTERAFEENAVKAVFLKQLEAHFKESATPDAEETQLVPVAVATDDDAAEAEMKDTAQSSKKQKNNAATGSTKPKRIKLR